VRKPNRKSVLFHRLTSRLKDAVPCTTNYKGEFPKVIWKQEWLRSIWRRLIAAKTALQCSKNLCWMKICHDLKNTLQYDIVFFPEVPNHTLLQQGAKCMSKLISSSRAPSKDIIHGHMIHSANCPREAEKRNEDIYEKVPLFQLEEQYSKSQAGRTGSLDLVYT